MILRVKASAAPHFKNPFRIRFSRAAAVRTVFSIRLISGAAAWPSRSSGAVKSPRARRSDGPIRPIPSPLRRIASVPASASPESAASNSSCPFPATPPMPSTSPACTAKLMFFSAVPNWPGADMDRLLTSIATAPRSRPTRLGAAKAEPTIISAMARAEVSRGMQVPTVLPNRRIVA